MSLSRRRIDNRRALYIRISRGATTKRQRLSAAVDYLRSAVIHRPAGDVDAVIAELVAIAKREEEKDDGE
jgi:hypothetical protein